MGPRWTRSAGASVLAPVTMSMGSPTKRGLDRHGLPAERMAENSDWKVPPANGAEPARYFLCFGQLVEGCSWRPAPAAAPAARRVDHRNHGGSRHRLV